MALIAPSSFERLLDEFCSNIDESLIHSIWNDHDQNYEAARDVLLTISQSFMLQDGAPTCVGSSSSPPLSSGNGGCVCPNSTRTEECRSFSSGSWKMCVMDLADAFPKVHISVCNDVLATHGGNMDSAALNLSKMVQLQDDSDTLSSSLASSAVSWTSGSSRAVDGFSSANNEVCSKKFSKSAKRQRRRQNKLEETRINEILFLADRVECPYETIAEVYASVDHSQGAALAEFLRPYIESGVQVNSTEGKKYLTTLFKQYPKVPVVYLSALVQICSSVKNWRGDLAAVLQSYFSELPNTQSQKRRLELHYNVRAPEGEEWLPDGCEPSKAEGKRKGKRKERGKGLNLFEHFIPASSPEPLLKQFSEVAGNINPDAWIPALSYRKKNAQNATHRRSSNGSEEFVDILDLRLSTGQAYRELFTEALNTIDLHRFLVKDGIQAARLLTRRWWNELGEHPAAVARQNGFTIITGLGRHCPNGVSPMRQGVFKMLKQEGWEVETQTGKFVVVGRKN